MGWMVTVDEEMFSKGNKFSSYKNANKAYDLVMDDLDALHEDKQATMMVDIPRFLQPSDCLNVSAPHYSSFFMSDIVAEKCLVV
jgi:hypothetical protein